MKSLPIISLLIIVPVFFAGYAAHAAAADTPTDSTTTITDSASNGYHLGPLTEEDFIAAAAELDIDAAAIHAVVEIEAGTQHKGFWKEGYPLINFDLSMFRSMARRNGINLSKYTKSHAVVFARPNKAKYGSYLAAQQARLDAALTIDTVTAIEGTFWGMFQIGGFNWKKCGASSPVDFAQKMARSERDQLELFLQFLRSTGLDKYLRSHNWSAFARGYNGPSYARRGYHTRLQKAYNKYKK